MLKTYLTVFVLLCNYTAISMSQTPVSYSNQSVSENKTIVGKFEMTLGELPDDKVKPTEIQHNVDEIIVDGSLMEKYNFIIYHFSNNGESYRARTYLDTINEVSLFGPYGNLDDPQANVKPTVYYNNVLDYLKRRFRHIQALDEEGYITIWKDPDYVSNE